MLRGGALRYELAERSQGIGCGGIGAMQQLVRRVGLARTIDQHVRLLKLHVPYHESDHVLNLAYNVLCGGRVLADIELRRQDGALLAALGTQSIPDPTTAGDFRRRFGEDDIWALMAAIDEPRLSVWRQHPTLTQQRARIDGDGTMVPTTGECKEGMDISHKGTWGYHPLLVSLSAAPTLVIPASSRYRLGEHESAALPKRPRPPKRGSPPGALAPTMAAPRPRARRSPRQVVALARAVAAASRPSLLAPRSRLRWVDDGGCGATARRSSALLVMLRCPRALHFGSTACA